MLGYNERGLKSCAENDWRDRLTHVVHHVHGALWEDSHLHGREHLVDHRHTVLIDHVGVRSPSDSDDKVRGSRVVMRWKHRARTQVEDGHGEAESSRSREGRGVGIRNTTRSEIVVLVRGEVVSPVGVAGQLFRDLVIVGQC